MRSVGILAAMTIAATGMAMGSAVDEFDVRSDLPRPKRRGSLSQQQQQKPQSHSLASAGRANLGRQHPDYGMTVAEHRAAKAERLTSNG